MAQSIDIYLYEGSAIPEEVLLHDPTVADVGGDLFLRPSSTHTPSGWRTELGGTDLHASINEEVPNDATFIRSGDNPEGDKSVVKIDEGSVDVTRDVLVRYRYRKEGPGTISLAVGLESPVGTLRSSAMHNAIAESFVTDALLLTEEEAAAVDWSDAYLTFTASALVSTATFDSTGLTFDSTAHTMDEAA